MKIKPLFDRVLIKPLEKVSQTKSGLIIPENIGDEPLFGSVVAIGDGDEFEGTKCEMKVETGDKVLFNKYGTATIKLDGEEFFILRQSDIYCIVKEED